MSTKYLEIAKPKKPAQKDWSPNYILALIREKNLSLQRLSRQHQYCPTALHHALRRPWPKGERIIADVIGVDACVIWPTRYHSDGTPKSGRGERGLGRYKAKDTAPAAAVNGDLRKAA